MEIEADRNRLLQIVANLLDNASKYSPPQASIELAVQSTGSWIRITVKNNGIGIPKEERNRIFERFVRGSHDAVVRKSGHGLGLSLVKSLVSSHGRKVEIDSEPERGIEVIVTLPPQ